MLVNRAITSQSISLNPNALVGGDLVIYGRVMEVIDYGSVANAFGAGDFEIDFGAVTDTKLYCTEDARGLSRLVVCLYKT